MMESSIVTGKVTPTGLRAGASSPKPLYVKLFLGTFTLRPPRQKQAKVLLGELLVRYSGREWPEKKNGSLIGDEGFLSGVGKLLATVSLDNITDISYASVQRELKEIITIKIGSILAKEIVNRGWANVEESLIPLASRAEDPEPDLDIILPKMVYDDEVSVLDQVSGKSTIEKAEILPILTPGVAIALDPTLLDLQPPEPKTAPAVITKRTPPLRKPKVVESKST